MRRLVSLLALALLIVAVTATAQAGLVVDRGLPTANLNDDPIRSNVMWADAEASATEPFWLPGDDFTLPGAGPYIVNTIRVWSTNNSGLSLVGGLDGGAMAPLSASFAATPVTYANGEGYLGNSGAFRQIYQIDFSVNIALSGGQKFDFFLDGPKSPYDPNDPNSLQVNAFLHASDKNTSVSPQEGSDDIFLWLDPQGVVKTWYAGGGPGGDTGTTGWGPGDSHNSDGNVQVFANAVPEPATCIVWSVLGAAAAAFAWFRRRRRV